MQKNTKSILCTLDIYIFSVVNILKYLQQYFQFHCKNTLVHENTKQPSAEIMFCSRNTKIHFVMQKCLSPSSYIYAVNTEFSMCGHPVWMVGNLVKIQSAAESALWVCELIKPKLWGSTSNINENAIQTVLRQMLSTAPLYQQISALTWNAIHFSHHLTTDWNMCYQPFCVNTFNFAFTSCMCLSQWKSSA